MSSKRTYVNAGVLISAFRGTPNLSEKAMAILDDPNREFVSSAYLELEVLPKTIYHKRYDESASYRAFFDSVICRAEELDIIVNEAHRQAETFGLAAMDAIHVAAAISTRADELVTTEKPSKPIHQVTGIRVISLQ